MAMFLQIVGAVVLVVIALVAIVVLLLWFKIRRALKAIGLKDFQSFARGMEGEPVTLELAPIVGDVEWSAPEAMNALRDFLLNEGFQSLGVFQTEAMGDLQLEAWADAQRAITAATYQHSALDKPWMDLVVREAGGQRSWTTTNAPMGGEIDTPPGKTKHYDAEATPVELLKRLQEALPAGLQREPVPASGSVFKERFEAVYAEEMEWRLTRGGPTEREVRAVMAQSGEEEDEDLFQQTHRALKTQAATKLANLLQSHFVRETTMSVAEWKQVEGSLVFVHDNDTPERLNDLIELWAEESESEDDDSSPFDPEADPFDARAEFARFNQKRPSESRFERIAQMSKPVGADVYKAPTRSEDDNEE